MHKKLAVCACVAVLYITSCFYAAMPIVCKLSWHSNIIFLTKTFYYNKSL